MQPKEPFQIRRVVVIGAGMMGHGIAQVTAMAGCPTFLQDVSTLLIDKGLQRIRANLDAALQRDKITQAQHSTALANLQGEPDLRIAASQADLIIEAVPENAELKRRIFATAAETAPVGTLWASNTSSIPVGSLGDVLPDPTRLCGMHFFNPVPVQPLLEIVRTPRTSDETLAQALDFAKLLGKQAIVVRDVAGFASSRLGLALGLEAMRMVEEGVASAQDIDTAMELGYRHPMGPLKLTDLIGLDVRLAIAETLAREIDPVRFAPPQLLRDLVAGGKLGRKSGEGFYKY